jgi:hypothetical protein
MLVVHHPDGKVEVPPHGQPLSPGDEIRVMLAPTRAAYAIVLDLDGRGTVTPWVPAKGDPPKLEPGKRVLEESLTLDDALGPHRVIALLCDQPPSVAAAVAAARAKFEQASGTPFNVAALGLPCREAMLDFQKVKRPAP